MKTIGGLIKLSSSALFSSTEKHLQGARRDGSEHITCSLVYRHVCAFIFLLGSLGLLAYRAQGQSVTVTNVFQNHYHYGYPIGDQNCPSGYNFPAGQYSSTYHLERGHAIHHQDPANPDNDYWVYWAHFDNASYLWYGRSRCVQVDV